MPRWIAALMPFNSSEFTLTLSYFYAVYMNENMQPTIKYTVGYNVSMHLHRAAAGEEGKEASISGY